MDNNELTFGRKLTLFRQKSNYTIHQFAQMMSMKLRDIENIENDMIIPEKKTITKMNRFLKKKMPYTN